MPSLEISITPSERAAGRFIGAVRRAILKALTEEEKKRGLTQSDLARAIGVHRSVINRELRGVQDISVGRIGQLAWALGRMPSLVLSEPVAQQGSNLLAPLPAGLPQPQPATSQWALLTTDPVKSLLQPKPALVPAS